MAEPKTVQVGDSVEFVDAVGKPHPAIITAVWGRYAAYESTPACSEASSVNLVYVSDNDQETDPYGRQIKRETSLVHQTKQAAHGMYWR